SFLLCTGVVMATEVRGAIAGDAITYAYTVAFKTFDVGSGALLLALRIGESLPQVASFFREVDAGAAAGHDRFGEPCCADGHCKHDDPDREFFCAGCVVSGGVQRAQDRYRDHDERVRAQRGDKPG